MDANNIPLFAEVNRTVHPADEMFKTGKLALPEPGKAFHYYFYTGGLLAQKVDAFLRILGRDPARLSLLDFACGYGRVTRYFAKTFGSLTCSDLEPDMLRFVNEITGADTFLSNVELSKVQFPDRQFDALFSFSLFTHLHPEIWEDWFWAVADKVKVGGVMFFTTRGVEFARRQGEAVGEDEAIRFTEKNETAGRLDTKIYGQTTISLEYVDSVLRRRPEMMSRVAYFRGGEFDMYQDMHVLIRRA